MRQGKLIVCLDFDGVINDYKGWRHEGYAIILDRPIPNARRYIKQLRLRYTVYVHSTRCGYKGGRKAIIAYLKRYHIAVDQVCSNKPRADYYVDDKGVQFTCWDRVMKQLCKFRHYSRREREYVRSFALPRTGVPGSTRDNEAEEQRLRRTTPID